MINILLKYILWYEFLKEFEIFVKKIGRVEPFLSEKYALVWGKI